MPKITRDTAWYAKRYIERFGLHIVPIEPSRKFPKNKNWGNETLNDPVEAINFYTEHPDWNLGISLAHSKTCALDIDDLKSFEIICDAFGINLDELIKNTPTIVGNPKGRRLEFRLPDGIDLPYHKLNWRPETDPDGVIYRELLSQARDAKKDGNVELEAELREKSKPYAPYTVFELRSSTDGKQRQNVYPPSIHPETGKPYTWVTQPRDDWPEPPAWLIAIWTQFDKFKPQLLAACPWAEIEEIYKPQIKPTTKPQINDSTGWRRVVDAYNSANDIESVLNYYGYKRIGKRYLSPNSSTGLPGVTIFKTGKAWIHHASDPLCSDESGQPVSAFDMYVYYEHNGDYKQAVRQAARDLNIVSNFTQYSQTTDKQTIDPETGEVLSDSTAAINYYDLLPFANDRGKPLNVIENLQEIIDRIGCVVRYNVIKKRQELLIPDTSFTIDNADNAALATLMSECAKFNFPTEKIDHFLTVIADQNQYNPVATWILSREWDGKNRLEAFYETIQSAGHEFIKCTLIKRWLVSAVAAAFAPDGIAARGVLVLQGAQGLGKTRWFKRLVPEHLEVAQDGVILRPEDKDSVKQAISNWLVELGELDATFKRSDIAQLKGFITRSFDVIRTPYARKESHFPRRTVFFGSVNPREFLNDPTGNTRFWTIECKSIDYDHEIDMQQLWAQVYDLYLAGEQYVLTDNEARELAEINDEYMAIDPTVELLEKWLDWNESQSLWRWEQVTQVLYDCGVDRPTRADTTRAAMLIRKRNGGRSKRGAKGERLLLVPHKILPIRE